MNLLQMERMKHLQVMMSLSQSAIEYAGEYLCSSARLRFRCFYLSSGSSIVAALAASAATVFELFIIRQLLALILLSTRLLSLQILVIVSCSFSILLRYLFMYFLCFYDCWYCYCFCACFCFYSCHRPLSFTCYLSHSPRHFQKNQCWYKTQCNPCNGFKYIFHRNKRVSVIYQIRSTFV